MPSASRDDAPVVADVVATVVAAGVDDVTHDSRRVGAGSCFVAVQGATHDGHDHVDAAVAAGARVLLVQRAVTVPDEVEVLRVPDTRALLGPVAAGVHGHPSRDLAVVGVTGTNGKTTVTWLTEAAVAAGGRGTGLIGTIGTRIMGAATPGAFTTPEAPDLQRLLRRMHTAGVDVVAMEVSSHGLALGRVDGTRFAVAVFTNLSQDHLDFHGDMDAYFAAKARLFTPALAEQAIVCVDDARGRELAAGTALPVVTYGFHDDADVRVVAREQDADGQEVRLAAGSRVPAALRTHLADDPVLRTRLVGDFNAVNAVAALLSAVAVGTDPAAAAAGIAACPGVPGRLERVGDDVTAPAVFVDYAHTPDAVRRALEVLRPLVAEGGRLVVVLGAGGDRDREKRPHMGAAAARGADHVVVTSDNPRSEDPAAIAAAVADGVAAAGGRAVVELDRRAAIVSAVRGARAGDVVLVAGKGHERGQTFADRTVPFDDRTVALGALAGERP